MKNRFLLILVVGLMGFILFCNQSANATHNRAGEITYRQLGLYFYEVTITVFTQPSSNIDRPTLELFWGDGAKDSLPRITNDPVPGVYDVARITYVGTHNYPGPATYTLHFEDQNRNANVQNIPNSVNAAFYVQSQLIINPFLGANSSPQLLNYPIDMGAVGAIFIHNAGAVDPDGDSLSYELFICKCGGGINCPGYTFPDATNSFSIDAITGDLVWDTPKFIGLYNAAFLIKEWRKGINIGYVERDMQIEIININNDPPVIVDVPDTCVEAGSFLSFNVTANDINNDPVTLTATGGAFALSPDSAYFAQPASGTGTVTAAFSWQTTCMHVRKNPWTISFKAKDTHVNNLPPPPSISFVDFETVNITVVAPAPKNLTVVPIGNSMTVTWDKEFCDSAKGYYVYRRNGFYGYVHGYCETGVPAYTGYVKVATLQGINTLTFTDNNNAAGLIPGIDYCYMIVAWFADGAESYASDEVCAQLKHDLPVITNVSIDTTNNINGKCYVAWSKPIDLDTNITPGPYIYYLYRATGFTGQNAVLVDSLFSLNDTTYTDTVINTRDNPLSYRIDFYNNTPGQYFKVGSTQVASSVFLTPSPTDKAVVLTWTEQVPWQNGAYTIFRRNILNTWDSINTVNAKIYKDTGLVNGNQYCYRVQSIGGYSAGGYVFPIVNYSQEVCAVPIDNEPPCAPVMKLQSLCELQRNVITWQYDFVNCPNDVQQFNIYYATTLTADPQLIAVITNVSDTIFVHDTLASVAGCYYMTATDFIGNESPRSDSICVDNCPLYELPNVFTPNGDGINDLFHPFPYSYVEKIRIVIYDRWGREIFTTENPDINWDGNNQQSNKPCPDGVYYYICTVYELYLDGLKPRTLTGFVQLLRN